MAAATDERLIYEILSAVGEIPEGNVATYGQIARLIGRPKNARLVGRVLSQAERYGGSCPAGTRRRRCSRARA